MAILENDSDYATGDQITAANLNALTESAKFVLAGTGVASTGNTTDETTLTVNGTTGELQVKDLGIGTGQLAADSVSLAKMKINSVGTTRIVDGAVTVAKMGNNSVDSAQYVDGSIDHAHLADDTITGADDHSATNRPDDEDELLVYDNSALGLVKMSLDVLAKHPSFPQAYGVVDFQNGNETELDSSYNVTSVAGATDFSREVTLAISMASATDYVVILTAEYTGLTSATPAVQLTGVNSFTIHQTEVASLRVGFAVFGTRAES